MWGAVATVCLWMKSLTSYSLWSRICSYVVTGLNVQGCTRLETSMNQLSLDSSFISLFPDSQRFLMFSFINFITHLNFLLIMCPAYLWVGNKKIFICTSLAHHVARLPLNSPFKLFFSVRFMWSLSKIHSKDRNRRWQMSLFSVYQKCF